MSLKRSKPRVLVIDDDEVILEMLERALGRSGYEVTTTTTTIGAGYAFLSDVPDLVVLDVRLAGSLPVESFCERLFKAHEGVQVILYSASDPEELAEVAERCGAQAYVPKTDGISSLLHTIELLVRAPRAPRVGALDGSTASAVAAGQGDRHRRR
jgi:DNA-binding response OmpR family regulator